MGVITRLSEQNEVSSLAEEVPPGQNDQMDLPDELEVLLNKIDVLVNSRKQKQITQLLRENQDVFALPGQPLCQTDLVKHDIVLQSQAPIKQAVRRPLFHLKPSANQEVQKMLENDTIETFTIPGHHQ